MKTLLFVGALVLAASTMKAELITFDDVSGIMVLPSPYAGLNWNNFIAAPGSIATTGIGYATGVVSTPNMVLNGGGEPASFSSAIPFSLVSGYFTSAFHDGLEVSVAGYSSGTLVDQTTFTVNTSGPILETFNWTGLTEVDFNSLPGGGTQEFVLDNLTVTPTPEPATLMFIPAAFALLGSVAMGNRRKKMAGKFQ